MRTFEKALDEKLLLLLTYSFRDVKSYDELTTIEKQIISKLDFNDIKDRIEYSDKNLLPKQVEKSDIIEIIEKRDRIGLFYCKDGDFWVGVDNTSGDAWTEDFNTEKDCIKWLMGK